MKCPKTCGSCLYFDKEVRPGEKKLHKDIGHKPYGKPCTYYEPNPFPLASKVDDLRLFARLVNGIEQDGTLENLAQLVLWSRRLRHLGFRFMQRVIVRWRGSEGRNYVNNFLTAYVVGASKDGSELRLVSYNGEMGISMLASRVMTLKQYQPLYDEMTSKGLLIDPKYKHVDFPSAEIPDSVIANVRTLDTVVGDIDEKIGRFERSSSTKLIAKLFKGGFTSGSDKAKSNGARAPKRSNGQSNGGTFTVTAKQHSGENNEKSVDGKKRKSKRSKGRAFDVPFDI